MRKQIVSTLLLCGALGQTGCFAFMTKEEGRELKLQIEELKKTSQQNNAELTKQLEQQLAKLKQLVDEATKVVTRNSADVGQTVQTLQKDLGVLQGKVEDITHTTEAFTKQFQEFRAKSDTQLEKLTTTVTSSKTPPVPETPDAHFAEAEKRMQATQWADARRLFESFKDRYPNDPRAGKAQFNIGECYFVEKKWANAIGAYTKVVDNFPKSDVVPDAMFKNGKAFKELKYCSDAKVYFQELLKRYPKTNWKSDAADEIKQITKDLKNKTVCES